MRRSWLVIVVGLLGCGEPEPGSEGGPSAGTPPGATGGADSLDDGLALLPRLSGLWSGPATQTPLGTFPLMNVDFRAMNDALLWGRVDLDPENALRFGLDVEARDPDGLIYRNGGFFLGMLRDDRTALVSRDAAADSWRFCHVDRGCEYIDAVYDLDGDDGLVFDVKVRGAQHVYWTATRLEERPLPDGFPSDPAAAPDAPLPEMPEARVTVSWTTPLDADADVWVILTTTPCSLGGGCAISRSTRAVAAAGAVAATAVFPEIHPGAYLATAVLDRDRNLGTSFAPGPGDGVSVPNVPIDVADTGITEDGVAIWLAP